VDVSGNTGGYVCISDWLHRIIVGPKNSTVPQGGLDNKARAGPLSREIVKKIVEGNLDPDSYLWYNPTW
jgi:hypothetical protein